MSNPEDLLYSASHEWAKVNGEEAVLGITHFAQESLGDITYVDMPAEGDELTAGSEFGAVESVKAASDLISPVSGTVVAVNTELENAPEVMNSDPYGAWLDRAREAVRPARRPDGRRGLRRTLQERAALVRGAAGPWPCRLFSTSTAAFAARSSPMPFIPHTPDEVQEMLSVVGVRNLDDLFADIPPEMRPKHFDLPKGQSEFAVCRYFEDLAAANVSPSVSFLGAGFYAHYVPRAVDALSGRSEFYTSYTPYQAECSQGTLQAIFEYQTAVSRLLDMDCANASVYDGGTALFEACMMAVRATRRKKLVVDQCINPIWRAMLETYSSSLDITLVTVPHKDGLSDMEGLKAAVDATCAAVLVQNPNFFGAVADFSELFAHARACKALGVISVYPVMQSVLKTPGEMGADIAVAEGQSLGQPLSFGGPYLGIMTCRKEHIRQFPGRIVGRTTDLEGRTGYVLTLQAREQHIRRAKATSNICSNQSLCALRALMYLSLVGPDGLARVAEHGMALARYAVEKLTALPGVSLLNDAPFGNEVALRLPRPAEEVVQALLRQGVAAGYPVGRAYAGMDDVLLLACTECNTRAQVDAMVEKLGGLL